MIPWRELAAEHAAETRIDPARYEEEFDAIDAAQVRAEAWEPSPSEIEPLTLRNTDGEEGVLRIIQVPTVPVAARDTSRLIVALFQYDTWMRARLRQDTQLSPERLSALLPNPNHLLRRRLNPDMQTLTDLVCVISAAGDGFPLLLKLLERCCPAEVPRMLREAICNLLADMEALRTKKRGLQRQFKSRVTSKREDEFTVRLQALLDAKHSRE